METALKKKLNEVDLSMIKCICETLEVVVARSVGPGADFTLITSPTGHATVTNDGFLILGSLHMTHPIGQFLTQAMTSLHSYTADGSKTYILYISEALRIITSQNDFSTSLYANMKLSSRIFLSRAFRNILQDTVPHLVRSILLPACTVIPTSNHKEICLMADNITNTLLASYFSARQHRYHGPIFLSVIRDIMMGDNFLELLKHFITNFDLLHIKVPNLTADQSRLIEPYVIQRDFSCSSGFKDQTSVRFILCQCSIDRSDVDVRNRQEPVEILRLCTTDKVGTVYQHRIGCVESFLRQCNSRGIDLIISTEAIPEFSNVFLKKYGMSAIGHILQEDMDYLQLILGKLAIFDIVDEIACVNVAEAKSCSPIVIGGHNYVHLDISGYTDKVKHQVLLSDITDGQCRQLAGKLYKTLKGVQLCFDEGAQFGYSIYKSSSTVIINENKATDEKNIKSGIMESSRCNMAPDFNETSFFGDKLRADIDVLLKHNSMYVIPAGGIFEFLASDFFMRAAKVAENSETMMACQILGQSLLALPRAIHKNASNHRSHPNRYIEVENQIWQEMKKGKLLGIGKNGEACPPIVPGTSYEPIVGKLATLCTVIQNLGQLLRIEATINVSRSQT